MLVTFGKTPASRTLASAKPIIRFESDGCWWKIIENATSTEKTIKQVVKVLVSFIVPELRYFIWSSSEKLTDFEPPVVVLIGDDLLLYEFWSIDCSWGRL